MPTLAVTLPIGLWRKGTRIKQTLIRPMTGADQEFLMEVGAGMLPAARTSALLGRCVERIGSETVNSDVIAELAIGDRETLLLQIRRATFGDKLDPVVRCPRTECGKLMDVPLRVSDLLPAPANAVLPEFLERRMDHAGPVMRFRLPTGADQEAAAVLAVEDPQAAACLLGRRCLDGGTELETSTLSELGRWMVEFDPQAEIRLSMSCPDCGHAFTSLFDAGDYLFEETIMRSRQLYREIHLIASHYHWSETEILAMPLLKRKRYLGLLREAIG